MFWHVKSPSVSVASNVNRSGSLMVRLREYRGASNASALSRCSIVARDCPRCRQRKLRCVLLDAREGNHLRAFRMANRVPPLGSTTHLVHLEIPGVRDEGDCIGLGTQQTLKAVLIRW